MAQLKRRVQVKRHPSERYRAPTLRIERWTNAKAALVGHLAGLGLSSIEISEHLSDGTSPETIRRMRKLWRLPSTRGVKVQLTPYEVSRLKLKATKHGLTPGEFSRRILATVARDPFDLYSSITDGAFEK